ncbi:MAG: glutathione S-transferase family protein, partial [Myxococcales bacterium]|nr:glutathione S-transferase family protein [Myxococcales bacterium]
YVALIATQPLFGANDLANSVGSVVAVDSSSDVDDQGQSLVFSWRVLEDRGDFIAVESLEEAERNQQCLREDNLFFHRYRLRALVPRDGLVPVTHVESEVRFGDGSMIRAGAGLHLIGDRLSYVDLSMNQVLRGLAYAFPRGFARVEGSIPGLLALRDHVDGLANIAAYRASPRCLPFCEDGIFRHYPELDFAE